MATHLQILVIDDSIITRQILRRILHSLGYENIVDAGNGRDALEKVRGQGAAVGLILVDWNMPIMNGPEFIRALRDTPQGARVPVVMVSAESAPARILEALRTGAHSYVIKPFQPNELRVKIKEALRLSEIRKPKATFAGSLADLGVPALVQLAATSALTGLISIKRGGATSTLGLEAGELRHCKHGDLAGDEAFLELAAVRDGEFEFVPGEPPAERTITGSPLGLVMEAMRRQDERLRAGEPG